MVRDVAEDLQSLRSNGTDPNLSHRLRAVTALVYILCIEYIEEKPQAQAL